MITIKNPKTQSLIDEILKRTSYSDPLQYLEERIKRDHAQVIRNKKLLQTDDLFQGIQMPTECISTLPDDAFTVCRSGLKWADRVGC